MSRWDEGVVLTGGAALRAGGDGATVWRWEVRAAADAAGPCSHRTTLRLAGRIDPSAVADELLIRLDSVAFPPGERPFFTPIKVPESGASGKGK